MNLSMLVKLLTHLPPSKDAYVPGCSLVAAAPGLPLELAVALGCSQERPAVPGWPLEVAAAPAARAARARRRRLPHGEQRREWGQAVTPQNFTYLRCHHKSLNLEQTTIILAASPLKTGVMRKQQH